MLTSAPEPGTSSCRRRRKSDDVDTIVHGVNTPQGDTAIISCASCTTNCITPVMEILGRRIGIKKAIMTTVHAYTASQAIVDAPHRHPREVGPAQRISFPRPLARRSRRPRRYPNIAADSMAWPSGHPSPSGRSPTSWLSQPTDDGGRGEPGVYRGSRERTLSRRPRRDRRIRSSRPTSSKTLARLLWIWV